MSLPLAVDRLPIEVIDELFARLSRRYGHRFMSLYDGLPVVDVKTDWAEVLAGCRPEDFDFACANLPPGRPPDAGEFLALCRRRPNEPMHFSRRLDNSVSPRTLEALKPQIERLKRPPDNANEPERVKVARRIIALHGDKPPAELMQTQRESLATARQTLEQYERRMQREQGA